MARLVWTEPALHDLNEIAEYIALDNFDAARKLIRKVFKTIEKLEDFPKSGRCPPELNGTQYREIVCSPCRIFYRLESDNIFILYVMRGERELQKFLLEERKTRANKQIQQNGG
ncbi:type II toxin-antitoxin system RelE/ParE family toxin [Candidatus Fermentibacteria bacterium]|nr:MAG: type II toxin-antitoxin system RelE/ParE family toxin [Candidatus Fermentibacteria bacterium]